MRYKFIDTFTPPRQITSVTINNITTSTIYDNSDFDSLVDSVGTGKIFIPTEKPEYDAETHYAKASYVDGDFISQVWEVVGNPIDETKALKERVNYLTERVDTSELLLFEMLV